MHITRMLLPAVAIVLAMALPLSDANASSLTLDTPPGINVFRGSTHLVAGATVTNVPIQPASFEAFHHNDANADGIWNGPDSRLGAAGTYADGLFGLFARSESLGGHRATSQYAKTRAVLDIDDLIITTDDPNPASSISTSVSFHVSGSTSHFNSPVQPEYIQASLEMYVTLAGSIFNGKYAWSEGRNGISTDVTGLGTQIAGGGFSDPFTATVTTGNKAVPVGTPFKLQIEFILSASSGGASNSAYGGMVFDARNTAGFLPGTPIFNDLPPGYHVTSVDAGISENMWGGPTVPIEPESWGAIKAQFGDR